MDSDGVRVAAAIVILAGSAMGTFLARLVYGFANPEPVCSQGPGGGPCWEPPAFWPYAVAGSFLGVLFVGATLALVARSLNES
jgi:hypothetical protein